MSDYRWTEKHYRAESIWESLIGKTVDVTWKEYGNYEGMWTRYRIDRVDAEWVMLQGMNESDEVTGSMSEYIGGPIVVRLSEIEMAEIVE